MTQNNLWLFVWFQSATDPLLKHQYAFYYTPCPSAWACEIISFYSNIFPLAKREILKEVLLKFRDLWGAAMYNGDTVTDVSKNPVIWGTTML